jgi:hypothetical protein
MATISIDLVSPHGTTPNVRIKQENPGFKLYEEGIKTAHSPSGWNTIADADKVGDAIGYYGTLGTDDDAVFKWNAQTPATDHRILYKYRGNYVVADLAKPDDGLSIILWNGVPKAQRKAVITVIYKNNASPSVDVTKVITVDYSDVEF